MRLCPNCSNKSFEKILTEDCFEIVKCSVCGLIYLLNSPDESELYEKYYDILFKPEDYSANSKFEFLSEIYLINRQRLEFFKKNGLSGKILDYGCGSGLFLKTISELCNDIEGVDLSQNALDFAKNEFGLKVFNKSADELLKENKKYDIITLFHVVEHFIYPVSELKKIYQLLNKGGFCFIEVPNFNSIKFRLSGYKWKGGNHPLYHKSFFTAKSLQDTLKRSGFKKYKRVRLSYKIPSKGTPHNLLKTIFNFFALDSFLNYVAYKN
ncbi:MAG TPA: class I SAM-dependent methyltransferase [Ignavibacteria bacterium]